MSKESILILNGIEKHIAGNFIQEFVNGEFPQKGWHPGRGGIYEISYEYHSCKQDKFVSGIMLGCPYKLRYRDRQRIFFSGWNVKDVCSIFYDMVVMTYVMAKKEIDLDDYYLPFEVDLNTETYVFFTGEIAKWLVYAGTKLKTEVSRTVHESQYILHVFDEPGTGVYCGLIERLKAENYDDVYVLQIWIRGEVHYFAIADGSVLRPGSQRLFTGKEEADLIRRLNKFVNDRYNPIDLSKFVHD
ncbi:MAG: hypothetical protein LBK66_03055 [Spirochaetaceae bacterium]|jgi:hypothetical protein|nr:hypothetical protein [Spirochaetaceae bacterium]